MKKAEMSILGALIAFSLILLIFPVIEFYSVTDRINITENNIVTALNEVATSDSILQYNDVKNICSDGYVVNTNNYVNGTFNKLGYLNTDADSWVNKSGKIKIDNISLEYNDGSSSLILKYKINVAFNLLNSEVKKIGVFKKSVVSFADIYDGKKIMGLIIDNRLVKTENGIMDIGENGSCGFISLNNNIYFLNEKGIIQTGWIEYMENKYYANSAGIIQCGLKKINTNTYYFSNDGKMVTGIQKINTKNYLFADSGEMLFGFQKIGAFTYYFSENVNNIGEMLCGWQSVNNNQYYFDVFGRMQKGWLIINDRRFFFNDTGAMQTYWGFIDGAWYFFDEQGSDTVRIGEAAVGWKYIDEKWYFFDNYGRLLSNCYIEDGAIYYWLTQDGSWDGQYYSTNDV